MILVDVNVLVYAHKEGVDRHTEYRDWLSDAIGSGVSYGMSDLVLSGFIRVVTMPRIFDPPSTLAIESGSEWITTDRDYARFPGLRWRHPLDGS